MNETYRTEDHNLEWQFGESGCQNSNRVASMVACRGSCYFSYMKIHLWIL